MISFESDYTTGAHPKILARFMQTNMDLGPGYGADPFTLSAIEKIKSACNCPQAQIYFAVGGTQSNQLVISTMLHDYEGVVSATTGHVNVHEAGAIEYTGHKVLAVPSHNGKMHADELKAFIQNFYLDGSHDHMVFPGMAYISQPTEYGSLYSKQELSDLHAVCREYDIPLFIDGARLGYGLMSKEADFTLADIAELCEVFYIGGTKVGALCGEAIVFTKNNMPKNFVTMAKRRGALVAKGRLLGVQFDELFTDGLYFECAKNAIQKKDRLVSILKEAGFEFFYESPTNQQFVIIENEKLKRLQQRVRVGFWEVYNATHTVIRFATSWSTTDADLDELSAILKSL